MRELHPNTIERQTNQKKVAQEIAIFKRMTGIYPTAPQIKEIMGIKTRQYLHQILVNLRNRGILKKKKQGISSLELVDNWQEISFESKLKGRKPWNKRG